MIILVDLAIAVAALLFGLGLKLIKENSKQQENEDDIDCCGGRCHNNKEEEKK